MGPDRRVLLGRVARVGQVVGEGSARRDGPALERVDLEAARDHDAVRRVAVQAPVVVGVVAARVRLQRRRRALKKRRAHGVHVALATETRVSGGDDTRVRTREVNVGLKFEAADPVDGVVVEAPALQEPIERAGIASELEALVALHQKGALTDGEFAAAKAKLLG